MAALLFVLDALLTLLVIAFLLRLVLPLVRADLRNPLGQAVLRITNPLVMPLRRLLRPAGRVDLASVAALLIVQLASTTLLQFYFVVVLLYALMSWVAPAGGPAAQLLARLSEPLLRPVRRFVPPVGGLDLSALLVLIGIQALQILLR